MAWYRSDWDSFPRKQTVGERQASAQAEAAKLEKRGRKLSPVIIEGNAIATTFWGKAWCQHLETYSDYETRLPRGRSYARNGSVIDLQLAPGVVTALVSGSSVYEITIDVEPLALPRWKALVAQCTGKIDSVVELLSGQLSDSVMEKLCEPKTGLFPSSSQLEMSCSCPDSASLCKHLAAVLYGVGSRLDRQPELLFVLRGVDQFDLIGQAAAGAIAQHSSAKDELPRDQLSDIFGIELAVGDEAPAPPKKRSTRKKSPRKPRR
jgi:uncharacterized Zn finger protein